MTSTTKRGLLVASTYNALQQGLAAAKANERTLGRVVNNEIVVYANPKKPTFWQRISGKYAVQKRDGKRAYYSLVNKKLKNILGDPLEDETLRRNLLLPTMGRSGYSLRAGGAREAMRRIDNFALSKASDRTGAAAAIAAAGIGFFNKEDLSAAGVQLALSTRLAEAFVGTLGTASEKFAFSLSDGADFLEAIRTLEGDLLLDTDYADKVKHLDKDTLALAVDLARREVGMMRATEVVVGSGVFNVAIGDKTYEPASDLDHGGRGTVSLYKNKLDPTDIIAVKQCKLTGDETPEEQKQLWNRAAEEAKIHFEASVGDHPNVLGFRGACRTGKGVLHAMEYAPHGDIKAVSQKIVDASELGTEDKITLQLTLIAEMAMGVAALHETGVVHNDLNDKNVFIGKDADCKLADFGESTREGVGLNSAVDNPQFQSPEIVYAKGEAGRKIRAIWMNEKAAFVVMKELMTRGAAAMVKDITRPLPDFSTMTKAELSKKLREQRAVFDLPGVRSGADKLNSIVSNYQRRLEIDCDAQTIEEIALFIETCQNLKLSVEATATEVTKTNAEIDALLEIKKSADVWGIGITAANVLCLKTRKGDGPLSKEDLLEFHENTVQSARPDRNNAKSRQKAMDLLFEKSNDPEIDTFLDRILKPDPSARPTAAAIAKNPIMKKYGAGTPEARALLKAILKGRDDLSEPLKQMKAVRTQASKKSGPPLASPRKLPVRDERRQVFADSPSKGAEARRKAFRTKPRVDPQRKTSAPLQNKNEPRILPRRHIRSAAPGSSATSKVPDDKPQTEE
jgi:serine/threonine protein kinase